MEAFMRKFTYISTAAILLLSATPAFAGETYIAGSVGIANQSSSDNTGETGAFTTGNLGDGSTLDVAAGTDYGWNTEFESLQMDKVICHKRLSSRTFITILTKQV